MLAVRYHESGGPDVLETEEVEKPTPTADEVLIEIRAASLNPTDARRRRTGAAILPKTTGSDFAGEIQAVGGGVEEYSVGDRVCGTGLHTTRFQQGSFAEYLVAPTDIIAPLPNGVNFEMGAAAALVGVTAWRALIDHGNLKPTETCLIHGGTGGVGHIAIQLANIVGSRILSTAGSEEKQQCALDLGADWVGHYGDDELLDQVRTEAPDGCDVILDHRVHDYFLFDINAAAFNGRIIQIGGTEGTVEIAPTGLEKNLAMSMMTMSNLATEDELPSISSILRPVLELLANDSIRPEIARRFALDEATAMHRALEEDSFVGKLIVHP